MWEPTEEWLYSCRAAVALSAFRFHCVQTEWGDAACFITAAILFELLTCYFSFVFLTWPLFPLASVIDDHYVHMFLMLLRYDIKSDMGMNLEFHPHPIPVKLYPSPPHHHIRCPRPHPIPAYAIPSPSPSFSPVRVMQTIIIWLFNALTAHEIWRARFFTCWTHCMERASRGHTCQPRSRSFQETAQNSLFYLSF